MSTFSPERIVRLVGALVAVGAGVAALVIDSTNDLEVVMLMFGAVVAGLLAFDTAMQWRAHSFGPWVLLSLAPVAKTVPTVWAVLRADSGLLAQRYDRAGSLLLGACVFGAIALLALPAKRSGNSRRFVAGVVGGTAITGALAGASVAFLFDPNLGSVTAARALETPIWFVLSGLLAATAIAASHATRLSFALAGILATGAATSALLAVSLVRQPVDIGWWALLFAAIAVSAGGTNGKLGLRDQRNRQSNAAVIVALIAGLIAATSAISARSDRLAWAPGWALLGVASLAMFALAMASKPLDRSVRMPDPAEDPDAAGARARAMATLQLDPSPEPLPRRGSSEEITGQAIKASSPLPQPQSQRVAADESVVVEQSVVEQRVAAEEQVVVEQSVVEQRVAAEEQVVVEQSVVEQRVAADESVVVEPAVAADESVVVEQSVVEEQRVATDESVVVEQSVVEEQSAAPEPQPAPASAVSDVSSRPATAVASATQLPLAPATQAHHFDPSTGLLSARGLQDLLSRAFAVPRQARHVTMLMFMIRDIDRIEEQHGRLASAAVTREVANRIGTLLSQGTGARFARSAYAVVFVADMSDFAETTQWLARVLLQLRAPVEGGSLGNRIDVVAGMAQCYEGEDVAQFIQRANQGLVRAAQLPEPTLVAMP